MLEIQRNYVEALRTYQKVAIQEMIKKKRLLMADIMGSGKTLTTLAAIEEGHCKHNGSSFILIVCPKFALYVWSSEISKWFGKKSVIYTGTKAQRKKMRANMPSDCQYLITSYGMLKEVTEEFTFTAVIADEIHNAGLLNHKTAVYKNMKNLLKEHNVDTYYLLTGTPVRQGVIDLYAPLSLLDPVRFNSYWSYVNRWCITIDTPFGKSIERRPKVPEQFRSMLKDYMIRRTLKEIESDLLGKKRQCIFVEKDMVQEEIYADLLNTFMTMYTIEPILAPNKMTVIMKLRQLLCCPKLLDPTLPYGSAVTSLSEMVIDKLDNNEPVVIFIPFRLASLFVEEYIRNNYKEPFKVYTLKGGLKAEEFASQWQGFEESKEKKKILFCVIKSGASFHATTASTCFFLGYDWDFNLNEQCEDRLNRIGQKHFVNVYYMMYKDTVDEDIAHRLNDKKDAADWAIGSAEQYRLLLRRFGIKQGDLTSKK